VSLKSRGHVGSAEYVFTLEDEMGKACSTNGDKRIVYRILVGKPERKRSLGKPRRRWVIILKWILVVWTGLIWLRIWTSGGLL
jgi:hypothetical protein